MQTLSSMRIRTAFSLALIALAACCMARDGSSQQTTDSDKPATVLKTPARDVVLPVTVHDKHGALVTSLQKNDLTLTEEGRPQTIKSFSRETNLPFRVGLLVEPGRARNGALEAERKAAGKLAYPGCPAKTSEGKE